MRTLIPRIAVSSGVLLAASAVVGFTAAEPAAAAPTTAPHAAVACNESTIKQPVQGYEATEVEWTANSCDHLLQERTWCSSTAVQSGMWITSGVVVRTYLWDATYCPAGYDASRGEYRISTDGGATWSAYQTFWISGQSSQAQSALSS